MPSWVSGVWVLTDLDSQHALQTPVEEHPDNLCRYREAH